MTHPSRLDELMRQAEGAGEWSDGPVGAIRKRVGMVFPVWVDDGTTPPTPEDAAIQTPPGWLEYQRDLDRVRQYQLSRADDFWPGWARALVLLAAMAFGVAVTTGLVSLGSWVLS